MNIIKLFSKTFQLIKYNLILVQPLLIFFLLLGLILMPITMSGTASSSGILLLIPLAGLFCAFLAGWFNMIQQSIKLWSKQGFSSKEERANYSINILKEFFPGVGKYFEKIVFGFILYFILYFLVINLIGIIGEITIGFPQSVTAKELMGAFANQDKYLAILSKMSETDKTKILYWNILTLVSTGIFSFFTMYWIQAIISINKNPFSAYMESFKTVIKNPLTSFIIFVAYWISVTALGILGILSSLNFVIQFLGLMLSVIIVVYFTIMIFLYFEDTKKDSINSWTDSIR